MGAVVSSIMSFISPPTPTEQLAAAIHTGQVEIVRTSLLDDAVAVAATERDDLTGSTPLHLACLHHHRDIVALLLEDDGRAAAATVMDHTGALPIHQAASFTPSFTNSSSTSSSSSSSITSADAEKESAAVIALLLDRHPDTVNARDISGCTPLHRACAAAHPAAVHVLCNRGADVNAVNCYGSTALHRAASVGSVDCCRILLAHGVDVQHCNSDGYDAASLASNDDVRNLLLAAAAAASSSSKSSSKSSSSSSLPLSRPTMQPYEVDPVIAGRLLNEFAQSAEYHEFVAVEGDENNNNDNNNDNNNNNSNNNNTRS